jgi:hypothetical protein
MVGRFNFKILNKTLWTFYVHMENHVSADWLTS